MAHTTIEATNVQSTQGGATIACCARVWRNSISRSNACENSAAWNLTIVLPEYSFGGQTASSIKTRGAYSTAHLRTELRKYGHAPVEFVNGLAQDHYDAATKAQRERDARYRADVRYGIEQRDAAARGGVLSPKQAGAIVAAYLDKLSIEEVGNLSDEKRDAPKALSTYANVDQYYTKA